MRSRQGLDIPICYGFYKFQVPWGETVTGVILEDLSELGVTLWSWGREFLIGGDGFGTIEDEDDSDQESVSDLAESEEEKVAEVQEQAARHAKTLSTFVSHFCRLFRCRINSDSLQILRYSGYSKLNVVSMTVINVR
jgi:hypothetical protein